VPNVDPDLLLAHLEYVVWSVDKTLAMVDNLPPAAVTRPAASSFPSIFATLRHIYQGERYYFIQLPARRRVHGWPR
jgi:uncharacterized damage-inducible protein DinB